MGRTTRLSDIPQVRAASLFNYIEVARFVGVDPYAMLRRVKIIATALDDPETRIAASAATKLVEDTAKAAGCPHFGLLMAECRTFGSLGPLSLLLQHLPTARAVVEALAQHRRHLNDITALSLEDDGDTAVIRTDFLFGTGGRQVVELAVAVFYRFINEAMAGHWRPERIHFRHSPPPDLTVHHRIFRCPLEFNSEFDGTSCSSTSLDIPNPGNCPERAAHAERYLELLAAERPPGTVSDRTRHAIYLLLPGPGATIERVADNLGIQQRSLQRLLEREGTSFAALLGETRRELALRYLTSSQHSVAQISALLGYATQSSFTRWFVAEFGESPAAWRSADRAEEEMIRSQGAGATLAMSELSPAGQT